MPNSDAGGPGMILREICLFAYTLTVTVDTFQIESNSENNITPIVPIVPLSPLRSTNFGVGSL